MSNRRHRITRRPGRGFATVLIAALALQGCSCVTHSDRLYVGSRPRPLSHLTATDLRDRPNPELKSCARHLGFLTTPFKRLGIFGWRDMGMDVVAIGSVEQVAISTDRFLTADLKLAELTARGAPVRLDDERFLRAEICLKELHLTGPERPCRGDRVRIAGRLMWDADGKGFLEVHPQRLEDVKVLHRIAADCP